MIMRALLVGSGPSLQSLEAIAALRSAVLEHRPIIAINRSVEHLRAHGIAWQWWAAIDAPTIARFGAQAPRVGLLTSRPTLDKLQRRVVEPPGGWSVDPLGCDGPTVVCWEDLPAHPGWGQRRHNWTITGAIALAASFGWRDLVGIGIDQAGQVHHDGSRVERPEHRWDDERREVQQVCELCGVALWRVGAAV